MCRRRCTSSKKGHDVVINLLDIIYLPYLMNPILLLSLSLSFFFSFLSSFPFFLMPLVLTLFSDTGFIFSSLSLTQGLLILPPSSRRTKRRSQPCLRKWKKRRPGEWRYTSCTFSCSYRFSLARFWAQFFPPTTFTFEDNLFCRPRELLNT